VVEGKEWFTAEDEHVCPFCDALDHQTYELNDNIFNKGDSLTLVTRHGTTTMTTCLVHRCCRCVLLPVRG
jgi:hypothetical protein